jgi:hypothetical protein
LQDEQTRWLLAEEKTADVHNVLSPDTKIERNCQVVVMTTKDDKRQQKTDRLVFLRPKENSSPVHLSSPVHPNYDKLKENSSPVHFSLFSRALYWTIAMGVPLYLSRPRQPPVKG